MPSRRLLSALTLTAMLTVQFQSGGLFELLYSIPKAEAQVYPGRWVQTWGGSCSSVCSAQGMASAPSLTYGAYCTSGEVQNEEAYTQLGAGIYLAGCWNVPCGSHPRTVPLNPVGGYCYHDGQKRDYDATDITAACYCRDLNPAPECSDGIDNDNNGYTDYPDDQGCSSASDNDESGYHPSTGECSDGIDNDGDGQIDFLEEGGHMGGQTSVSPGGTVTTSVNQSGDTIVRALGKPYYIRFDDDSATRVCEIAGYKRLVSKTKHHAGHKPRCFWSPGDNSVLKWEDGNNRWYEVQASSNYGSVNAHCIESVVCADKFPDCSDRVDNDADGQIDFPRDSGCESAEDHSEIPHDTDCSGPNDEEHTPQCRDGIDNDNDGETDHPNDPSCTNPDDDDESPSHNSTCQGITAPSTVNAGETFDTTISFKNTGDAVWNNPAGHVAGTKDPDNNTRWGPNRAHFPGNIGRNQTVDISYSATAPTTPGTYDFNWQMLQEGVEWFGPTCDKRITVVDIAQCENGQDDDNDGLTDYPDDPSCTSPTDDDESPSHNSTCEGITAPSNVIAGSSFSTTISFKNKGDVVWTNPTAHIAGTKDPDNNTRWGPNRAHFPGNIGRNQTVDINYDATAPTTPGTYDFNWQMLQEGVEWFGPTCDKRITVDPAECDDGVDNDGDGQTDYPRDPGCSSPTDNDELGTNECDDGVDNDGDGQTDYPRDPNCSDPADDTEGVYADLRLVSLTGPNSGNKGDTLLYYAEVENDGPDTADTVVISIPIPTGVSFDSGASSSECVQNGNNVLCNNFDLNDGQSRQFTIGLVCDSDIYCGRSTNHQATASASSTDPNSGNNSDNTSTQINCPVSPECDDGIDNDGDGQTDFPRDPGCTSANDTSELGTNECDDGVDNDSDGQTDYPRDPGCSDITDDSEAEPACDDGIDNDGDGQTDYPRDPGCSSATDDDELGTNECDDGIDNDNDGQIDYPRDSGCSDPTDTTEDDTPAPTCDGHTATVYVNAAGKIVGGPYDGYTYQGTLRGSDQNDVIVGTDNRDYIYGRDGDDIICGLGGNDNIDGDNDDDTIYGGEGNDDIDGEYGDDIMFGGPGSDEIEGGRGNDTACGDEGDDELEGDSGNDELSGGDGNDEIKGGHDSDICIGESVSHCEDTTTPVTICGYAPPPPACSDGVDNDGDGQTDFPRDPGCTSANDISELGTNECDDGIDNDNDGQIDFPRDSDCTDPADTSESPPPQYECSDGTDNDSDGQTDYPNDSSCSSPTDDDETNPRPDCDDGQDNDGDGHTDYPNDQGCSSPNDVHEGGEGDCSEDRVRMKVDFTHIQNSGAGNASNSVILGDGTTVAENQYFDVMVNGNAISDPGFIA